MRYYSGRRNVFVSIITSIITFVIMTIAFLGYIGTKTQSPIPRTESLKIPKQNIAAPQQISAQLQGTINTPAAEVASRSVQPVVGIAVLKPDGNSIFKTSTEKWGIGSGIIVDPNGYILTNHHVAGGKNKRIIVTLSGGDSVDGVTLWSDSVIDLAVVKINVSGLPAAKLGDSGMLRVGEPAIAVGNPLGLQFQKTVTSGIVSALNRTVEISTEQGINYMEDLIQTDASINPGNSGGPLMNSKGEVIGINTIKVTAAEGIGFAIPINIAKPIVNSFINKGKFEESYLGVFAYDREIIPYIQPDLKIDNGVYVSKVDFGSPAAAKGIRVGDIITKVDNTNIRTMMDLRCSLYNKSPNDTVRVDFTADGVPKTVQVSLGKKNRDGLVTR
ncbi:MAG: S1C family serine protease [Deltaproteobacteria bacterium]